MNCAQHTDAAAVAYCRNCGKALCDQCKREVQGSVFCEPCLTARLHPGAGGFAGPDYGSGFGPGYGPVRPPENASPGLALFLGFIPGVGAFYNGQFLKGFVHVIVLTTLIWMSDNGMGLVGGLLIPAWFFYMVFDAYTTARARRDGMPIPDPIGLNHIIEGREGTWRQRMEQVGGRMGTRVEYAAQNLHQQWQKAGGVTPGATPGGTQGASAAPGSTTATPPPPPPPPGAGAGYGAVPNANPYANPNANPNAAPNSTPNSPPGSTAYVGPQGTYYSGPEGSYYVAPKDVALPKERSPIGAVVLIGLGVLLLLANLGWFSFHWVSHFWPLILITIGLWLFMKRRRGNGAR